MEVPRRTGLLVAGLAIAVGLSIPAPALGATGPRIRSVDVDASPFGAVVTVQLRDRLTRIARDRAVELAGVGVALAHDSGRPAVVGLNVARAAIRARARRGTEGPVPVFIVGKTVTFFIRDSRIASVEEVVVGTYTGVRRTRPRARHARIGVKSAERLFEDVAFAEAEPEENVSFRFAQLAHRKADQGELTSCEELRRQVQRARDLLNDPPSTKSHIPALNRAIRGALRDLEQWLLDARAKLAALCDPPGSPGGGNPGGGSPGGGNPGGGNPGGTTNRPPTATFTASPNNPPSAPKPGQTVQFDGSASSDPDGTLTSLSWTLDNAIPPAPGEPSPGSPSQPSASGPTTSASFSDPGRYPVTLTVTDNAGGSAFMTRTIFVSGPGSKARTVTLSAMGGGCSGTITGFVEIYIPTYAQPPLPETFLKTGGCQNATLTVKNRTRTFNTAPPDPVTSKPRLDAWGQVEDTYRIEFEITGGTTGAGSVEASVAWN